MWIPLCRVVWEAAQIFAGLSTTQKATLLATLGLYDTHMQSPLSLEHLDHSAYSPILPRCSPPTWKTLCPWTQKKRSHSPVGRHLIQRRWPQVRAGRMRMPRIVGRRMLQQLVVEPVERRSGSVERGLFTMNMHPGIISDPKITGKSRFMPLKQWGHYGQQHACFTSKTWAKPWLITGFLLTCTPRSSNCCSRFAPKLEHFQDQAGSRISHVVMECKPVGRYWPGACACEATNPSCPNSAWPHTVPQLI